MGSPGHGETQAIALHPTNPMILYAGAAKGLCKTTVGGKDNWPTVGLDTYSPRAIVVGQQNPDVVYAGTHKVGVYRSSDAGQSWVEVNEGIHYRDIRAMLIHPGNDQVVYAGTDGGGVYKTVNGGSFLERDKPRTDRQGGAVDGDGSEKPGCALCGDLAWGLQNNRWRKKLVGRSEGIV